jgi:hypothetical protein
MQAPTITYNKKKGGVKRHRVVSCKLTEEELPIIDYPRTGIVN